MPPAALCPRRRDDSPPGYAFLPDVDAAHVGAGFVRAWQTIGKKKIKKEKKKKEGGFLQTQTFSLGTDLVFKETVRAACLTRPLLGEGNRWGICPVLEEIRKKKAAF